ncbi:FecR family protein [Chitinophaga sp. 22620]|uniref:FecR family protein n=1 Tax=Chitinophaga sp. 22620 TaxID=3453952 RepID=UPI003F842D1C
MMDKLTEEERFLLLGKVTGTLTQEEEVAWEHLFNSNPDARTAYAGLANQLPVEATQAGFRGNMAKRPWRDLAAEFRDQQQVAGKVAHMRHYKKSWVAAAVLVGILAGAGILWNTINKTSKDALTTKAKPGIELKLAGGKIIDLSKQQGGIDAGTVRLNNSNKTLSYATGSDQAAAGVNTLTVPIGMDYKLHLADGSEVWLNSATELEFPLSFAGQTREITIRGEAYLKVTKDAARPFIVHLPHSTVEVLGTEFNVNTYDSGVVKVALVEGAVNLRATTRESKLTPGKQAIYHAGGPILQEIFDARQVLSWRKGLFYFNNASLEEISKVVPRWYGVQVMIDDPAILSRRFSGVINRNRPIAIFLEDLKVISHIDARIDQAGILHFK